MNQRIRELADQILPNEREFNKGDPKDWGYFFSGEELEKFAELIVQRCAEICMEMSAKCAGLPGDGALAKDCAYWIKKDFGVKE